MKSLYLLVILAFSFSLNAQNRNIDLNRSSDIKKRKWKSPSRPRPVNLEKADAKTYEKQSLRRSSQNKSSNLSGVDKQFAKGWDALASSKSRVALGVFEALVQKRRYLSPGQRSDAYLGYGISLFHEKGCAKAKRSLSLAQGFARNNDDATYYLGLCHVENKEFELAKTRFKKLLDAQHVRYSDPARFYIAVVDEEKLNYSEAKSSYQDIIDFSSDKGLVSLAKKRLAILDFKIARDRREKKRVSFAASLGFGHDTNATLLPQGLDPSSQTLDAESSLTSLGLLYAEYRIPYAENFDQVFSYNILLLHYLSHKIALSSDLHSHEMATQFNWDQNMMSTWSLNFSYNYVFLGEIKELDAYMATIGSELSWKKSLKGKKGIGSELTSTLGISRQESIKGYASAQDPEALNYNLGIDWMLLHKKLHVFGPGVVLEVHPSKGSDNTYWKYGVDGTWTWTLMPNTWKLKWTNSAEISNSRYYDSSTDRKDWYLSASTALAKTWGKSLETRLQFSATRNISTEETTYQYNKYQSTFIMSTFF